jgi:hypothetical protein
MKIKPVITIDGELAIKLTKSDGFKFNDLIKLELIKKEVKHGNSRRNSKNKQ